MRFLFAACLTAIILLANLRSASAAPTTSLDLRADRVTYFSNRYIVVGEGHVRVRWSDGSIISGEFFSMDLKLNRYLIAGHVQIDSGSVHDAGAAFAGYPDLDRSYFLSSSGNPDKWTFFGTDFVHPNKGRVQPSDAFFIPDLSAEKPYIIASSALILPKTSVKFNHSRIYTLLGLYVPTGSWDQIFSANPYYEANGFAGASFDIGVPYNGSLHSVSAFHLRYTGLQKLFLSFDQHFVWGRDYIVFSINPLTQEQKQYNLIAYKRISPKMEARIFSQISALQHGIYQPIVSSAYNNLSYTASLPHSAISLNADLYNSSLLQYPPEAHVDNSTIDESTYDHPSDAQASWVGRDTPVKKNVPLYFRLRSGYGFAHDGYHCGPFLAFCPDDPRNKSGENLGYVLDYFGASRTVVPTIFQKYVGITLYTASLPLDRLKSLNFNVTLDKQRQWFSLPHHIDTTNATASLSKIYTRKLAFLAAYSVSQLGDFYGARQLEFYPPDIGLTYEGAAYPGYAAFRGFATTHVVTGSAIVTPNQYFNYAFTIHHEADFPQPVPGLFGNAPWQFTNEIRIRIAKQILMDISRTDYLNFGGFTPSFNVQFGP